MKTKEKIDINKVIATPYYTAYGIEFCSAKDKIWFKSLVDYESLVVATGVMKVLKLTDTKKLKFRIIRKDIKVTLVK